MLRKILRWSVILLAAGLGLALTGVVAIYLLAEAQLSQVYDLPPETIAVPTDAESIARGEHLTNVIFFCATCHGENMSGQVLGDDWLTGRLAASNLTPGQGSAVRDYSDSDWAIAIRHGVLPDRKAGMYMMSNKFNHISDADVGAMIAYYRNLPPVDNELPETQLGPMGRFFLLQNPSAMLPALLVDHTAPRPPAPEPGVTAEYGEYLTHLCTLCHGEDFGGGRGEGPPPGPNLTPGGDLATWTEDDFIRTLRTGVTPDGKELDPEAMPWKTFGQMTDDELKAVWLFLQSRPPLESPTPTPAP